MNILVRAFHSGQPSRIHAVKSMLLTVANVIERLSPEYLIFAFDGGHTERTALHPEYKAHRPPKPPELVEQIKLAEKALNAIGWPMVKANGWEADDLIASLVKGLHDRAAGVVVCSSDKDLLQLLGQAKIYHPWEQGTFINKQHVFEKHGVLSHQIRDYLSLVGDKTDGVPGVMGVGPKSAAELLAKYETLDGVLEAARLQRIVGATGKKLQAGRSQAELSRDLVTLNADIPVPDAWADFPAMEPRPDWIENLRKLELGMVVQRLMSLLPAKGVRRPRNYIFPIEYVRQDAPPVAPPAAQADVAKPRQSVIDSWNIPSFQERAAANLKRAMETDFTADGWWSNFPALADFHHPDTPREILDRSIYANVRRASYPMVNDWRKGTNQHHAHALALAGLPFSMPVDGGLVSPPAEASSPATEKPLAGSLF